MCWRGSIAALSEFILIPGGKRLSRKRSPLPYYRATDTGCQPPACASFLSVLFGFLPSLPFPSPDSLSLSFSHSFRLPRRVPQSIALVEIDVCELRDNPRCLTAITRVAQRTGFVCRGVSPPGVGGENR